MGCVELMDKKYSKEISELIQKTLDYDPESGVFTFKVKRGCRLPGDVAGYEETKRGVRYYGLSVNNKSYRAGRVAWFLSYGAWPSGDIDHIDGNGLNNRLCNLRDVSRSENLRNCSQRVTNSSGFNGVSWMENNQKWRATISVNGKNKILGHYKTHIAASYARHYANLIFGYHANHGRTPR